MGKEHLRKAKVIIIVESKVLLLKDTGLENYTVGKYIYKYKVYKVLFKKKQKQPVDTWMTPSLPCI